MYLLFEELELAACVEIPFVAVRGRSRQCRRQARPVAIAAREFVAHERQVAVAVKATLGSPMAAAIGLVLEAERQIRPADLARRRNFAVQPIVLEPRPPVGLPANGCLESAVPGAGNQHDIGNLTCQPGDVQARPVDDVDIGDLCGGDPLQGRARVGCLARDAFAIDQDVLRCLPQAAVAAIGTRDDQEARNLLDHIERGPRSEACEIGAAVPLCTVGGRRNRGGRVACRFGRFLRGDGCGRH